MDRDFRVQSKGLKRTGKSEKPFITLETLRGEKLVLYLNVPSDLSQYEIKQEFTVKVLPPAQQRLKRD